MERIGVEEREGGRESSLIALLLFRHSKGCLTGGQTYRHVQVRTWHAAFIGHSSGQQRYASDMNIWTSWAHAYIDIVNSSMANNQALNIARGSLYLENHPLAAMI